MEVKLDEPIDFAPVVLRALASWMWKARANGLGTGISNLSLSAIVLASKVDHMISISLFHWSERCSTAVSTYTTTNSTRPSSTAVNLHRTALSDSECGLAKTIYVMAACKAHRTAIFVSLILDLRSLP